MLCVSSAIVKTFEASWKKSLVNCIEETFNVQPLTLNFRDQYARCLSFLTESAV